MSRKTRQSNSYSRSPQDASSNGRRQSSRSKPVGISNESRLLNSLSLEDNYADEHDLIDETTWEVEEVVGKRYDEIGRIDYRIKWKAYDGEPTWEPESNCDCPRLIQAYEDRISRVNRASTSRGSSGRDSPSGGDTGATKSVKLKTTPRRSRAI